MTSPVKTSSNSPLAEQTVAQGGGSTTTWVPPVDLPEGTLFWRARGLDPSNDAESPWSQTATFEREFGIDLNQVVYVQSPNIANWPETSKITSAFHNDGQLCIFHTQLGSWPATDFFEFGPILEGNQFIFANINGVWHGGAADWYRPGQACKGTEGDEFTGTFYQDGNEPLRNYAPRIGDTIGLMSSTPNRFYPSMRTVDERSNVVLVRYGG